MSRPLAVLLLVICTMLWGFAFVAQKGAMAHMGPLTFSAVRYIMGTALVAPLAIAEYRRERRNGLVVSRRQWIGIAILSLFFFLGVWLQQAALITASVTNGGFITSLYVIFTPIVGFLTLRTRPHPIVYLGIPLALIGIYLLTGADLSRLAVGDGLLLGCAICWGVQVALLGQLVKETRLPVAISTLNFLATGLLALLFAPLLERPDLAGIANGWIEILYAGILSTAVAFTLQAVGQQYVPPANAAIILSAESLFAALGGAILLGERLPPLGYFGAAMIFGTIVLVELVPVLAARRVSPSPGSA